MGKSKDDGRKATNGDDILVGTSRNDTIDGRKGNDQISGLDGNDKLIGGKGNDLLDGGAGNDLLIGGKGNDKLLGGAGNDILYGDNGKGGGGGWDNFCWWRPHSTYDDFLDGGAGNDRIYAGRGDDLALYNMQVNLGAHDYYDGGTGYDTLQLALTYGELRLASVQKDIADFQAFLRKADSHDDDGKVFQFKSFDLQARNFEALAIQVVNNAPTANNDSGATDEDTRLVLAAPGLLANDTDPDHLDVLRVIGAAPTSALGAVVLVAADGALSYDPRGAAALQALAVGETATDSFSYTIADLGGLSATGAVKVTVKGVNDAPVAQNDTASTDEDTVLALNVLANDTDPDTHDTHSVGSLPATSALGVALSLDAAGNVVYDPREVFQHLAVGESATDSFTYVAVDNHGAASGTAIVQIAIAGVNDAPVAEDDLVTATSTLVESQFGFESGSPADLGGYALSGFNFYPFGLGVGGSPMAYAYTGNDFVANGADGSIQRADGQDFALLSLDVAAYFNPHPVTIGGFNNGVQVASLTVDLDTAGPSNGLTGYASIGFDASWGSIDEVRFYADNIGDYTFIDNLHVAVATPGNEDMPQDIAVLANDHDPDASDVLHVDTFDAASAMGAAISLNADGTLHYDPTAGSAINALSVGETATDTFSYGVSDGHGGSDSATVSVQLIGVNDAPTAVDDAAGTDEDSAVSVDVLPNDTDPDAHDVLHVGGFDATSAMGAAISLNADGTLRYDPTAATAVQALAVGESATDTFQYTVSDGHGGSDTAAVSVEVAGVNDAPVAADDSNLVVDLRDFNGGNAPDYFLAGFTFYPYGFGVGDSGMAYADTNSDSFADGADGVLSRLDGENFAPLSLDVASYLMAGQVTIAGYDDGVGVASMVVDLNPVSSTNGMTGYTSISFGAEWGSIDELRFFADDVGDLTFIDNLRVAIGSSGNEDTPINLDVLANDRDPDASDVLEVSDFSALSAMGASVSLNPNGTLNYDPTDAAAIQALAADESATDTFTYTVSDGRGGTDSATVSVHISGVNDAPSAADDAFSTDEDTLLAGGVLGNDSDIDSTGLSAVLVDGPGHGTLVFNEDGSFSYAPEANFNGSDSFTYRASDGFLQSNLATVALAIAAVNDAPAAADDAYNVAAAGTLAVAAPGVLDNDFDVEGDSLQAAMLDPTENGTLDFHADGSFTYVPDQNFTGTDSFTYTATDGQGTSNVATVRLTVTEQNSPPDAVNDTASTNEDTAIGGNVIAGVGGGKDTDPDGDTLSVTTAGTFTSTYGASVTLNANGSFTYDPRVSATLQALNTGQSKADSFSYDISDGHGGTDSATVTVNVAGVTESTGGGGSHGSAPITPSVTQALTYYVQFKDSGGGLPSSAAKWVKLDTFSMGFEEPIDKASGLPTGKVLTEDVELRLGAGSTVTALTKLLLDENRVTDVIIQAQAQGKSGQTIVVDSYKFHDVLLSGLDTSGSATATENNLSFAFAEQDFEHTHSDTGLGGAVSAKDLGDGFAVNTAMKYYVRIETTKAGVSNWLAADSFSMDLSVPVDKFGGGEGFGDVQAAGQPQHGEVSLLLGSSSRIPVLTDALLSNDHLKFVEVEAYKTSATGQLVLVDEFQFKDGTLSGLQSQGASANELSFTYQEFTHGHTETSASGTPGASVGAGWDFSDPHDIGAPTPHADVDFKAVNAQATNANLTYYVQFKDSGGGLPSSAAKWVKLDTFSMGFEEPIDKASGLPTGKVLTEDVELRLGAGSTVTALTKLLLDENRVTDVIIQAQAQGKSGQTIVVDSYKFHDVLLSGLDTSGSATATENNLSFAFAEQDFEHTHSDTGLGGAVSAKDLGDGFAVNTAMKYYVRIETTKAGVSNWLAADSFSMDLSVPVDKFGGGEGFGDVQAAGQPQHGEVSLLLGSSSRIPVLTDALLSNDHLKFVEVEAYKTSATGQLVLVDEFQFKDGTLSGLQSQGASANELSFTYQEFTHGHTETSASGTPGASVGAGWDFSDPHDIGAPTPHADVDFKAVNAQATNANLTYYVQFKDSGGGLPSSAAKWVKLDTFSMGFEEPIDKASGLPTGKVLTEDVELRLGAGSTVTALTKLLLDENRVTDVIIQAQAQGKSGQTIVVDSYKFHDVLLSGLDTSGSATATENNLSFAFAEQDFEHTHSDTGLGGAVSAKDLGDGFAVNTAMKYYVRIETTKAGVSNWLAADSFSMDLSVPVDKFGGGEGFGDVQAAGQPQHGEVSLLLGSSSRIPVLTDALLSNDHLKFVEVEAYKTSATGQLVLVDEFQFKDGTLSGLQSQGASANELSFTYQEFTHGHTETSASGTPGASVGAGWDFSDPHDIGAPTPHSDVIFH